MSSAPTLVGPTTTQQINQTLYVGEGYLHTIQNAVDFAVKTGGGFQVVIPAGYAGSDTIAAVVNGAAAVYIVDERQPQTQTYSWIGGVYTPTPLHLTVADLTVDTITATTITADTITASDTLHAGTAYADNLQVNQTLNAAAANVDGSPVRTFANSGGGGGGSYPEAGIAVSTGTAWDTSIDPETLATYPGAGIPVSTGTAWGAPINPATVAFNNKNNNFTVSQTVPSLLVSTLGLYDTRVSGAPAGATAYVATNGAVGDLRLSPFSTAAHIEFGADSAWGTTAAGLYRFWSGVDGSGANNKVVALIDRSGNVEATSLSLQNAPLSSTFTTLMTLGESYAITGSPTQALFKMASTIGTGNNGHLIIECMRQGVGDGTIQVQPYGGGSFIVGQPGAAGGTTTMAIFGDLQSNGNLTLQNNMTIGGQIQATGNLVVQGGASNGTYLNWSSGTGGTHFGNGTTGAEVASVDDAGNATFQTIVTTHFSIPSSTNNLEFSQDGGTTFIDGGAGGRLYINNNRTGGTVQVNNSSFIVYNGSKNFLTVHPLDDTKYLAHSCIEGPECAVFYRGEGVTAEGTCEITLPDYFENLVMATDRSVQLTALFEDDNGPVGFIAAGRVIDGKFKVRSSQPIQKFYWEVKAVRADIPPLEIVTDIQPNDPTFGEAIRAKQKPTAKGKKK
jgi:hypothetical protein